MRAGSGGRRRLPGGCRHRKHGARDVTVLGLGEADRKTMSDVLTGSKRVERSAITVEDMSLAEQLLRYASGGRLVLVMVNRVARAQELFLRVKAIVAPDDSRPEILLLHSRFRPRERAAAMARLRTITPDRGRIVISTQVLEAGVDLDADVLVSEVCPWPSLEQRLGRLNRHGRKEGVVHILEVPVEEPTGGWPKKKADREQAEEKARSQGRIAVRVGGSRSCTGSSKSPWWRRIDLDDREGRSY